MVTAPLTRMVATRRAKSARRTAPAHAQGWPIRDNGPTPTPDVGPLNLSQGWKGTHMAAMKPRTGDGPLEVTKEGRGYVMRVPLEGGGRLVVELNGDEAKDLGEKLLVLFA